MYLNRWTLGGVTLAGLVCIVLLVFQSFSYTPAPGVTKVNFDRIEKGMTRAEVEVIFGKASFRHAAVTGGGGVFSFGEWEGDDGARASFVFFDDAVQDDGSWTPSTETLAGKLLRWVRLK